MNEFENKLWFHTVFVSHRLREEKEFVVYVDKNGSVKDFLLETEKEVHVHYFASVWLMFLMIVLLSMYNYMYLCKRMEL